MVEDNERQWVVAEGRSGGLPIYMRVRSAIPDSISRQDFPQNLIVTWKYEPKLEGLPSDTHLSRMELLEDLLVKTLSAQYGQSHLLVVTTTNGVRQWLWKTKSAEEAVALFAEALGGEPPFPIEICADDDPNWDIYQEYLLQIGAAED